MIRAYEPRDLDDIVALFQRSVREVASRDYAPAEVAAWAPERPDLQAWRRRLATGGRFVLEREGRMLGFTRIDETGYLDMLFVHPDAQRQGVARALLERVVSWAAGRGIRTVYADVSITARPFFQNSGFRVVREQASERQGVVLRNFRMEHDIEAAPPLPAARRWTGASGRPQSPADAHRPVSHRGLVMDEQTMFTLLVDLHRDGARQGPGSDEETLRALALTRLDSAAELQVADIGCGTGASTLALASRLPRARIIAVDRFPAFLDILAARAHAAGCSERIATLAASMESLPFAPASLDLIWSEGAIYNMGFGAGVAAWRPLLRPGGVIGVSEITWLRPDPPEEIRRHWNAEYPEMATASAKIAILEGAGYDLLGYLVLPSTAWMDNYYAPTDARIPAFLERHAGRPEAAELVELERREADLYRRYRDWFGYGFYVARKRRSGILPVDAAGTSARAATWRADVEHASGPNHEDIPVKRSDLIGRWRLLSYTTGAEYPMGRDAIGVLQYSADGKVSVHIMGEGYFAYFGDYTVDEVGMSVTHHLELCSDPKLVGASNLRNARLEGGRLTLTGSMRLGGETREIRVVWEREGD